MNGDERQETDPDLGPIARASLPQNPPKAGKRKAAASEKSGRKKAENAEGETLNHNQQADFLEIHRDTLRAWKKAGYMPDRKFLTRQELVEGRKNVPPKRTKATGAVPADPPKPAESMPEKGGKADPKKRARRAENPQDLDLPAPPPKPAEPPKEDPVTKKDETPPAEKAPAADPPKPPTPPATKQEEKSMLRRVWDFINPPFVE